MVSQLLEGQSPSDSLGVVRVLILIGNFESNSGGAQRAILNQVSQSDHRRVKYTICHLFGRGTARELCPAEVDVVNLRASFKLDVRIWSRLRRLIREREIRVIHTQSPVAGVWGRLATRLGSRVAVVSTEQNVHARNRGPFGIANGLTLPWADCVVSVSEAVRSSFFPWEKWLLKRRTISTIYNGIPLATDDSHINAPLESLRREFGFEAHHRIIGNVARLDPQKGQADLLREFAIVARELPEARLLIVGGGKLRPALERQATATGIADKVVFAGARNDVARILRILEVFAFPSIHEGFSLALLEAMAHKLPIVCSDIPPVTEAVGKAAIVVAARIPGELSRGLLQVLTNRQFARELGELGWQRLDERFSANRMAREYEELYRQLAHRN